jgi:hypothetical protein
MDPGIGSQAHGAVGFQGGLHQAEIHPIAQSFLEGAGGPQHHRVLGGAEGAQLLIELIGPGDIPVLHVLKAGVQGGGGPAQVVGITEIAGPGTGEEELVVEGEVLMAEGIQQGGVGPGQIVVMVADADQVSAQGGEAGRSGQLQKGEGLATAIDLGRRAQGQQR